MSHKYDISILRSIRRDGVGHAQDVHHHSEEEENDDDDDSDVSSSVVDE